MTTPGDVRRSEFRAVLRLAKVPGEKPAVGLGVCADATQLERLKRMSAEMNRKSARYFIQVPLLSPQTALLNFQIESEHDLNRSLIMRVK
jgi:hypothetical protein